MLLVLELTMKRLIGFLLPFFLFGFISCQDDDEPVLTPDGQEEVVITDVSGSTVTNTKDIVVGNGEGEDVVFEMSSTVMNENGRVTETTLNCCAMAAICLDGNKTDTTRTVENVTLVNKGVITVHTKDLVERYADLIQDPEHPDRPYTYLRVLVMYAGKKSTVINEGTINVYFDHDPSVTSTVYVMALVAGEGSTIMNNGEINVYGNGSVATRLRGMATFGDDITAINNGTISAELDMSEDARMITTGGTNSNVINNGIMKMRMPGKILCMTRYGDSNLINNNTIDITSTDMPEGYESIVGDEDHIVCGLYEPLQASRTGMPSLLNRGTIHIAIEGSERSEPLTQGYGMFCDLMAPKAEQLEVNIVNDGLITLEQSGPVRFNMAEAGFVAREVAQSGACNIHLGRWQTALRDFARTQDLFLAKGARMNFSGAQLLLLKGDDYQDGTAYSVAPEDLMYNAGGGTFRYEYSSYDNLVIKSADSSYKVDWDREAMKVSFVN